VPRAVSRTVPAVNVKVKWLGHSAFLFVSADGTRIITDPYIAGSFGGAVAYNPIREQSDAVTVSHEHDDHCGWRGLPGGPQVISSPGQTVVKSVTVTGFDSSHDDAGGSKRGGNVIYRFELDGIVVCHCGDLGEKLDPARLGAIGPVDVLLVPVGGLYTIDAGQAHELAAALSARITIPMHYKTVKVNFQIAGVDDFTRDRPNVRRVGKPEVEITREGLPAAPEIWVLEHAL